MEDYSQFIQQVGSWAEELLLRGISQFTLRDVEVLEQFLEETKRFQLTFLQEVVEPMIMEGRHLALGNGDEELLLRYYCRLTQYVQLSVQETS
ncbi:MULTISPECIES: hypothetical protein [Paenibacillus]|uniref:Uncharacterized protein n=1 Tax=Paenibacillus xylanilyticus TaxID=248903 RepID=A0A7Y6C3N3_9BACL|nr:hypothetical protein [Paenibacillus xylanilyticus]NUU78949.1 hypothetical protein [Paenibacillus xylanilyticus]